MTTAGINGRRQRQPASGGGRSRWVAAVVRLVGIALLIAAAIPALAQTPANPQDTAWFDSTRREWDRILDEVETYFGSDLQTPDETRDHRALLEVARSLATAVRRSAQDQLNGVDALLAALGPPPAEGAPPEADDIAAKRLAFAGQIATVRGQIALADVALARIEAIEQRQSSQARDDLLARLMERRPVPVDPRVIIAAAPEFLRIANEIATVPVRWYAAEHENLQAKRPQILAGIGGTLVVLALGWLIRRAILRRFGPDPAVQHPRYAARLLAAVARFVAIGIIPAILLGLLYAIAIRHGGLLSPELARLLFAVVVSIGFYAIIQAISLSLLSPDQPQWQIANLIPKNARRVFRRIGFIAGLTAVETFLNLTASEQATSPDLKSVYLTLISALEVVAIVLLAREHLWQPLPTATPAGGAAATAADLPPEPGLWRLIRRLAVVVAVAGLAICLAGYVPLGRFLLDGLFATAIVAGALLIFRAFVYDSLELVSRLKAVRSWLHLPDQSSGRMLPLIRIALDPALALLGIVALAPAWGAPTDVVTRWVRGIADGITIGGVTLSPVDIVAALITFFLTIAATRLLQRNLLTRVFPYTSMPIGLQHSVAGGLSYLGVIAAAALAIAVLGIDLTNIAIVLGALSVGIGFGLQNIVNNFVSGLILLIERPVNVGDWVVVGGLEGIVKRISIRATEIETWQRASIIVPNAEVVSNAITNLTLNDRFGRLEIDVIVPFGADTRRIEALLLDVARAEPEVVSFPAPFAIFRAYVAYGLQFRLHAFIANVLNRLTVTSTLLHAVDARLRAEGVTIPYPQSVVHLAESQGTRLAESQGSHLAKSQGPNEAPAATTGVPPLRLRDPEDDRPPLSR